MQEVIFLFLLGLIWIIFASIQDIRTREVANWISFSLIIFALGFRFFYSLFTNSFSFFYQGLIGLAIFFVLGNTLYYAKMFAGGDAKLMIALGPILGFSQNFSLNLKIYALFIFLFLFSGAVYGFIMTLILSFRDFHNFKKGFAVNFGKSKKLAYLIMGFGIFLMILGFITDLFFILGILVFLFPYFYLYAKTVDNVCMVKNVKVKDLTEGDWLYQEIKIGKTIIKPKWEGLNKEEIKKIRKKYKSVKIKQGIAFVPVFLVAFLILFYFWVTGSWNIII
jgi:Flp pilus assembly protein protease CpaA